jgi:breast cancer 2 susceptibility protein
MTITHGGVMLTSGLESEPDYIENLYDDLEDPTQAAHTLTRLSISEAGWLARHIREVLLRDRERVGELITQELDWALPLRVVRNFRVLVVGDAETRRRPGTRTAQLTVWDVLSITHSEGGKAGAFEEGQKFRVTNLVPTQKGAWMGREPGAQVFLTTRRDSRWIMLK